jgi:hypothetical protein
MRKLIKLANRIVFQFDALACRRSLRGHADPGRDRGVEPVDRGPAGRHPARRRAVVDTLNQGYVVDTVLTTPTKWANVVSHAKILDRAPREGQDNLVVTGNLVGSPGWTSGRRRTCRPV